MIFTDRIKAVKENYLKFPRIEVANEGEKNQTLDYLQNYKR